MTDRQTRGGLAVVGVTRGGVALAAEIAAALGDPTELCVPRHRVDSAGDTAIPFDGPLAALVRDLWGQVDAIVLVLALGATVRLIGPHLSSKRGDPAVVVVDEAGRFVIPVIGGHAAGANALAIRIADTIGATPTVTTASEVLDRPALDLLGRDRGWHIEATAEQLNAANAASVNGEPFAFFQDVGESEWREKAPAEWVRLSTWEEAERWDGWIVVVTDRATDARRDRARWVVYRPPSLVLGVGCSTGAPSDEIGALVTQALSEAGLSKANVRVVATIDRRLTEPSIQQLASALDARLVGYPAVRLASVPDAPSPSSIVAHHVGTPGVCEPAALLASEGGELLVPKRRSKHWTVAVARRNQALGRRSGRLSLVSLGPGAPDLLPPRARQAIREADVVVGYRAYLELVSALFPGKRIQAYELGQEWERARDALETARAGKNVALVSSGDAGVYGMAGLALELLGDDTDPTIPAPMGIGAEHSTSAADSQASDPAVTVVPGITAASAAAALLGAPLMLDFAVISLSDLLVPWEMIERRLVGAAQGDFVIALYNPASARRRWQLARAAQIILDHRDGDTPVGLVREAERPEQSIRLIALRELAATDVDMKTVVIVGNSTTRRIGDRVVTRRGYDAGSENEET